MQGTAHRTPWKLPGSVGKEGAGGGCLLCTRLVLSCALWSRYGFLFFNHSCFLKGSETGTQPCWASKKLLAKRRAGAAAGGHQAGVRALVPTQLCKKENQQHSLRELISPLSLSFQVLNQGIPMPLVWTARGRVALQALVCRLISLTPLSPSSPILVRRVTLKALWGLLPINSMW